MPTFLPRLLLVLAFLSPPLLPPTRPAGPPASAVLHYLSPMPGSLYIKGATNVALRLDDALNPASLTPQMFSLVGNVTGLHAGQAHVALDGRTAVFKPNNAFQTGETVSVTIASGLTTQGGAVWAGTAFTFTIETPGVALSHATVAASITAEGEPDALLPAAQTTISRTVDPANYVTLPDDLPAYTVSGSLSGTVTDTYALGPVPWVNDAIVTPSRLLLLDSTGEPVLYQTLLGDGWMTVDVKLLPGNLLSYWSETDYRYHLLDNTYTEVRTIAAGNGYLADLHEMQLLPNGEALLMIYDYQTVDMSLLTPGGQITASVAALIVQSVDAANDVVFQWRSWDHFLITETTVSLTAAGIDYVHGNAIDLDDDGNLLVSNRHLDEITKINRDTAAVMWRLGGPRNEFTFIGDPEGGFFHQHDIRRLPNGNISLFDNHNESGQTFSRAVIYTLDEISKTATFVWDYRHSPDVVSFAMGSHGELPDGRVLVGWGSADTATMTEIDPDESVRLEVTLDPLYRSYRAARFPWVAAPAWPPTLVLTDTTVAGSSQVAGGSGPALYFSWNGATEIDSYAVFAVGPVVLSQLALVPRTAFEDHILLADLPELPAGTCAYRVSALDANGQTLGFTNRINFSEPCLVPQTYLPLIIQTLSAAAGH